MPDNLSEPLPNHLDRRIAAALATPPATHIPADFATRIAADALARFGPIPQPRPAFRFGTLALYFALAALLLAMLLLAHHPGLSPTVSVILQATLATEFILLALYLARPHPTLI